MKRFLTSVFLLATLCAVAPVQADEQMTVAVMPFRNTSNDPTIAWLSEGIGETLSTRLPALAPVRIIERAQTEKLIKEIYFSQSALVDENASLEVGKLISAKYLVLGSFQVVGAQVLFNARLVKVENGQIIAAADASGPRDMVLQLQSQVAEKLAQSMSAGPAAQIAPKPAVSVASLLPPARVDFNGYQALERVRGLLRDLPRHELDPLRQRNQPRYYQALEYLERILAGNPDQIEALLYSGQVHLNLGENDKALAYFQKAAQLAPASAEPAFALGIYYKSARDFGRALPALQQAVTRDPRHAEAAYAAAVVLHLLQRDEEALDYLFRALSHKPGLKAAETLVQTILGAPMQNQPPASFLAAKAGVSTPYAAALLWLAFESRQPQMGAGHVGRVLTAYPDLYRFPYHLGLIAYEKNQLDLAYAMLQRSISLYPVYAPAHLVLGDYHHQRKACAQSTRHYKLYLHLANTGERFGELRQRIQACGG